MPSEAALASLFAPASVGALELPHRVVMGSMHLGFEAEPGAGERLAAFYRERALGGAGLICTGGWAVCADGAVDPSYGLIPGEEGARALELVAAASAGTEAAIALQLFHAGRYAGAECPGEVVAPSPVPSRVTKVTPRELSGEEIWAVIEDFAAAADRARELGFAAVEVMGSEGYLVDQFLSPLTNRREDEWGADAEGRMRFGVELARAVRAAVGPGFPLIFRMTGAELMPHPRPFEEVLEFARGLAAAGVDALNIGVGWHESPVPTVQGPVPPGVWAPWAEAIKTEVGKEAAVIAGNRLNRLEDAAALLERGGLDLVSMSRPFLADAELVAKGREGVDGRALNVCISCNQACIDRSMTGEAVSCLVNPRAGFEAELPLGGPPAGGRYAVVGGGPAGMAAARELAAAGAGVDLFEAAAELGGQFRYARLVPGKEDYGATIDFYESELERLGATVHLERRLGEEDAAGLAEFDGVVLATGVLPRRVELPGAELPSVLDYAQAFEGGAEGAERVAIVGAGGIGVDLAHWLASRGHASPGAAEFLSRRQIDPPGGLVGAQGVSLPDGEERGAPPAITLLRRNGRVGAGIGPTTRWVWLDELRRAGVEMRTGLAYGAITEAGLEILPEGGEPELVAADRVVIAAGQERNDALGAVLERAGARVIAVGGAVDAAELNAVRAFAEGMRAARELIDARAGRG